MQKSKAKVNKSAKVPKPIKIKKEKTEEDRTPQPMSHYVDDRLELVKQIFGSLKPKTITNLAPDFLKKKDLDEIQEMCLNELLGISTKRLLSVINATKCPTDTESSSDSDVHNLEDHVSLEEISSDSQVDGFTSKSRKKMSKRGTKSQTKNCNGKKINEENENDAQISVLELLELQARARAIRSQLALEPVTKIEVNSGDESEKQKSRARIKENEINNKNSRKRNLNDSELAHEARRYDKESKQSAKPALNGGPNGGSKEGSNGNDIVSQSTSTDKKFRQHIKLKRNFRNNKESANKEENEKNTAKEIKQEKLSRSASPDVIPIVAEPVTLMIGDTSDDDDVGGKKKGLDKPTEATTVRDPTQKKQNENIQNQVINFDSEKSKLGRCNGEQEDGEIVEETPSKVANNTENEPTDMEINGLQQANESGFSTVGNLGNVSLDNIDKGEISKGVDSVITSDNSSGTKSQQTTIPNDNMSVEEQKINKGLEDHLPSKPLGHCSVEGDGNVEDDDDDDQNDDVISIEGGDLENEMTEHLQDKPCKEEMEVESIKVSTICSREVEDDVISLESSEDDLIKDSAESWNSRWLKSSKVSKVLAASRLGKRVRDKIKKTKRSNNDFSNDEEKPTTKESSSSYASKHEDGSIEQYKELLEIRQQRKT